MSEKDSENSSLLSTRSPETAVENEEVIDMDNDDDDVDQEIDNEEPPRHRFCNPIFIIIISLLVILLIMMAIVMVLQFFGSKNIEKIGENVKQIYGNLSTKTEGRGVCETNECATLSHQLMNWRNQKIDPCDDFYEATCGRYLEHTNTEGTRVAEKESIVRRLITKHLHKNISTFSKSENALKLLLMKCEELRHPEKSETLELQLYHEVFKDIRKIAKWPILDANWTGEGVDLNEILVKFAEYGMRSFGFFEIFPMEFGGRKYLYVRPEMPKVGRGAVVPEELKTTIEQILSKNKIAYSKSEFEKDFRNAQRFSMELAENRNMSNSTINLQDLQTSNPSIDFSAIIAKLVETSNVTLEAIEPRIFMFGNDIFVDPEANLEFFLKHTESRVVVNMLIFKFVEKMFHPLVLGRFEKRKDNRICVDSVINALPRAALRVFVRNYMNKANLKLAAEMTENIKLTYYEIIDESEWLNPETKRYAKRKVQKMRMMIGYPEEYETEGALDRKFETLKYSPDDSFYELMKKTERFKTEQIVDYVLSDTLLDPLEPLVVANAYYFAMRNFMNILVPFLVDPIFDANFPKYATMSGVGRVLAHEIGHAFDMATRSAEVDRFWNEEQMNAEYHKRARCLMEQYEEFVEPEYAKEATNNYLLSEIIADALGTQTQWRTYKKMNMTGELKLHGFEQEPFDKLYFYIGALDFCSPKDTRQYSPQMPMTHPPNKFRVNGVFANMKSFAETFNCPAGSKMNPTRRCQFF